jgi:hypothetical protein
MAAILSKEQEKARELVRAIGKDDWHVWVVSPESEPRLRIQVQPCCRAKFLSMMHHTWGWRPQFVGLAHRTSEMGFRGTLVEVFELDVPAQLQTTLPTDARKIPGDD